MVSLRHVLGAAAIAGAAISGLPQGGPAPLRAATEPLYAWVQMVPPGVGQARALVPAGTACPDLVADGRTVPMRVRAPADRANGFAVTSCQADLPAGASALRVGSLDLPAPKAAPQRIAVIGDTGCRIKGDRAQACDDPAAWPFPAMAAAVAAARPDLIVHVGDYLYRESPCPEGDRGCAGSEWGYNWGTWQADFFAPAGPMLATAPLLLLRGNHETCGRAWRGWYRFLAERDWTPECHDYEAPYAIDIGARRLVVLDSTHADDREAKPHQVMHYQALLHAVNGLAAAGGRESWLVSHKPFWSIGRIKGAKGPHPHADGYNAVLQAAEAAVPLAPEVTGILSGHFHLFQALSFEGGNPDAAGGAAVARRPNQLILGNGGTMLARGAAGSLPAGFDAWGLAARNFVTMDRFGFGLLEPSGTDWQLTLSGSDGTAFARCTVVPFDARCAPLQ